jgi:1-acyl-sn-glycerol-3-phosphate acyltransferase
MKLVNRLVTSTIKGILRILCRVDDAQLAKVPDHGPLILVSNHVNFLEAPLVYTHLLPRQLAGFAKAEAWKNPFLCFLAKLWGPIPLRRGEVDRSALRQALAALEEGLILGLAPEGTRSGDGRLQQGKPGTVLLALRSGAPLLPVVHYGGEHFWRNLARLRRTSFHIVVGEPFYVESGGIKVTRHVRRQMTDEIMFQMAALLPPVNRGVYAHLDDATDTYLRFPPGSQSNLSRTKATSQSTAALESQHSLPPAAR